MSPKTITLQQLQQKRGTLQAEYQQYLADLVQYDPQANTYNGSLQMLDLLIEELTPAPIAEQPLVANGKAAAETEEE